MFFIASKLAGFVLLHPVNFLLLAALAGVALGATRFARLGRRLVVAAVLLLAVAAFSPLAAVLLRPLEDRFTRPATDADAPTGIVVLGGALDTPLTLARGSPSLNEAAGRLTEGAALLHRYPGARLVFTGGSAAVSGGGLDEAQGVRALWTDLGVPPGRMGFESRSRNTYENAVFTRDLVHPQPGERWLLVTSAAHMPRSIGIFRQAGWPMVAYPVDYRTFGDARDLKPGTDALDALRRLDVAIHEWAGLLAYRLTGKTDALFPAP